MKFLLLLLLIMASFKSDAQVIFNADFESGNLLSVNPIDSSYYEVRTKEDIGGRWFYFKMKNVMNRYVKVKVINSDVTRAMYSYDDKNYTRFSASESPSVNVFQKTYTNDSVFVAYYTPYNYSYLMERINEWKDHPDLYVDTLGLTPRNFPMLELTVTDKSVPDDQKERVWIHARTHPGETPSSWHMEGIIETLLNDDEVMSYFRKKIIWHLFPLVNPEGVYYGRSRTNYNGIDLERDWNFSPAQTTPEVALLKQRMVNINNQKIKKVFLNLHSQAAPYCTFWIHTANSTSQFFYKREHQFSNLQISEIPYFVFSDYRYSALQNYFPEGFIWNNYGDKVMALTYETPYDRYSNNEWVTNDNLKAIGRRTVYGIAEYIELSHSKYIVLDNKDAEVTGLWNTDTTGMLYYSDNYFTSAGGTGAKKVTYRSEAGAGKYDVWAWWPSSSNFAFNTKFRITAGGEEKTIEKTQKINGGQWNFLTEVTLNSDGNISIVVDDSATGIVAADAFRIIFRESVVPVEQEVTPPSDFILYQNFPNPFNPATTIRFKLKEEEDVVLRVFNSIGELVATLVEDNLSSGEYNIKFDSRDYGNLASGVYYYSLATKKGVQTRGMVLVK
jgi:hypothetical protein